MSDATSSSPPTSTAVLVLGGGCFWCTEAVFKEVRGVLDVESGYSNGQATPPSYEAVCTGHTGCVEVVRLVYDPAQVSTRELLARFDPESAIPDVSGLRGRIADILAAGLSLYALYWVVGVVPPQLYRLRFLLGCLVLTFLLFPSRRTGALLPKQRGGRLWPAMVDLAIVAVALASLVWPLVDYTQFVYRATEPLTIDLVLGSALVVIVLEATRRTTGWVLPLVAGAFLAYAYYGPLLDFVGLGLVAHRGYDLGRLIGTLYMTLEGIFGVPLDVAVLGMGEDGHTASWFPDSPGLAVALAASEPVTWVRPAQAPHLRLTLTLNALLACRQRHLSIAGQVKQQVFAAARQG
jgi:hypothetical protein